MVSRITAALAARYKAIQEKEKGFTLIELLVVVIIIGVLAAIAIPIYIGVQNNAKDSSVQSDVSNAKTAVVAFQTSNNGEYPAALGEAGMSEAGYTEDADNANYTSAPALEFTADGNGFCIEAVSVTGTSFAASDKSGVAKGSCNVGVFSEAQVVVPED